MAGSDSPFCSEPGATGKRQRVNIFEEKYFNMYERFSSKVDPFYGGVAQGY